MSGASWRDHALVASYFLVTSLGHLRFSQWLVTSRATPFGDFAFSALVPAVALLAAIALLAWLLGRALRGALSVGAGALWLLWLAAALLAQHHLAYSINEFAHFPQYALLAVLVARVLDPGRRFGPAGRVLFWTTLLGMVDEVQQYLWLTPTHGDYLDFNDFLVNLLGAAAGVMFHYRDGVRREVAERGRPAWLEIGTATVLSVAIGLAVGSGRVLVHPPGPVPPGGLMRGDDGVTRFYLQREPGAFDSLRAAHGGGRYRVLGPASGMALIIAGGLAFSTFPRVARRRVSGRVRATQCRVQRLE